MLELSLDADNYKDQNEVFDLQDSPTRQYLSPIKDREGDFKVIEQKKFKQQQNLNSTIIETEPNKKQKQRKSSSDGFENFKEVFQHIKYQQKADQQIKEVELLPGVKIIKVTQDNKIIYYTSNKKKIEQQETCEKFESLHQSNLDDKQKLPKDDLSYSITKTKVMLPPINTQNSNKIVFDSDTEVNKQKKNSQKLKNKRQYQLHIINLNANQKYETFQIKQPVSQIHYGKNGKYLILAYKRGIIEILEVKNLNKKGMIFKNLSKILQIVSDDQDFAIVSDISGKVQYIKLNVQQELGYKDLQKNQGQAFTHLMLTPDSKHLVGFQKQQQNNLKFVFNGISSFKISIWNLSTFQKYDSINISLQDIDSRRQTFLKRYKATTVNENKRKVIFSSSSSQDSSMSEDSQSLVMASHVSHDDGDESEDSENSLNIEKLMGSQGSTRIFMVEKISKIALITTDNRFLIIRDSDLKGITLINIADGTVSNEYKEIHKLPIVQMLICKSNQYIITSSRDNKVKVFDLTQEKVRATLTRHLKPVTSIAFTPDQRFLFSYGFGTQIILWSTQTWQNLCHFKTQFLVQSLTVTQDQRFLVLEGLYGQRVFFLEIEQNEGAHRLDLEDVCIQSVCVTPEEDFICLTYDDSSLNIWNLNEKTFCSKICCENPYVQVNEKDSKFYYSNKGDLFLFDPLKSKQNGQKLYSGDSEGQEINYFIVNKDGTKIIIMNERCVLLTKKPQCKGFSTFQGPGWQDINYNYGCLSQYEKYLFAVSNYTGTSKSECSNQSIDMYLITNDELKIQTKIKLELKQIYGICCGPHAKYIFICGDSTEIIYFQFASTQRKSVLDSFFAKSPQELFIELYGHTRHPTHIALSRYEKYVVSKNDFEIIVWDSSPARLLTVIEGNFVLVLSKQQKLFGIIHQNQYKLWSDRLVQQFSEDFIPVEQKKNNTTSSKPNKVVISGLLNQLFDKILNNFINENKETQLKYVPAIAETMFQPFNINMLHYFAYKNNQHALHACIESGIKYQRDYFQQTPLQYAIAEQSFESIDFLLDYISQRSNLYAQMQKSEIVKSIKTSSEVLEQFFENSIHIQDSNMPQFGRIKGSGDIYFQLLKQFQLEGYEAKVASKGFLKPKEKGKKKIPIQFKALKFKLNYKPGSVDSIEFHKALDKTEAECIFRTEAIQMILKYKWEKVRIYSLFHVIPLLLFALILFIHSVSGRFQYGYLVVLGIISLVFLVTEVIQLKVNFKGYFTDFWNILDLIKLIFTYIYIGMQGNLIKNIKNPDEDTLLCLQKTNDTSCYPQSYYNPQITLVILNSLIWIRIISYLRLFSQTRALIRLLIEIIKDMASFSIVLIVALIAIAINYSNLNNKTFEDNMSDQPFITNLKETFLLMFASFSDSQYESPSQLILFVFASILIPLVMLNMLIAIMGDTFERVSTNKVEADGRELNMLILEQESLMFWVGKEDEEQQKKEELDHHLHWAFEVKNKNKKWVGKLQIMQQTILQANKGKKEKNKTEEMIQKLQEQCKKDYNMLNLRFTILQKQLKRQALKEQYTNEFKQQKLKDRRKTILKAFSTKKGQVYQQEDDEDEEREQEKVEQEDSFSKEESLNGESEGDEDESKSHNVDLDDDE